MNMTSTIEYRGKRGFILKWVDFFYPMFRTFMDLQTFRYLALGGANTLFDIFLYFISYNFILDKEIIHLPFLGAISPHIGAFLIAFCITFPIGFLIMRTMVFTGSVLRGRIQLVRYFSVAMLNIFLNYVLLKLFVEQFGIFPTPSKIITTGIVVLVSYLLQRFFTFK